MAKLSLETRIENLETMLGKILSKIEGMEVETGKWQRESDHNWRMAMDRIHDVETCDLEHRIVVGGEFNSEQGDHVLMGLSNMEAKISTLDDIAIEHDRRIDAFRDECVNAQHLADLETKLDTLVKATANMARKLGYKD